MKRNLFTIVVLLLAGFACAAQTTPIVEGVSIDNLKMEKDGSHLVVETNFDLSNLDVNYNRAVLLTPMLVNGTDTLEFPSVGIYGRNRYYYYVRNGEGMLTEEETSYRASRKPDFLPYHNMTDYQDWMNHANLVLRRNDYGCCSNLLAQQWGRLGDFELEDEFYPTLVYIYPNAEIEKTRHLKGQAFIDFPVDETIIYPDYRRNTIELGKIQGTIDSVRNDRDITITSVWLKGFASPESPYEHNTELAIGRTAALKKYICQLYKFDESVIATEYEPENWEGLRLFVENSNINHRQEILDIIDCSLEPDSKEWKLKSTYPEEYQFLLKTCYPALRRTDYRIDYTIRTFSNIEEIKRVFLYQPGKLSLNEFYLLSKEYEPGSDAFTGVFVEAVKVFPDDEVANLNAANAAMRHGDLTTAAQYLAKAGNSPEATYARGAFAFLSGDYAKAKELFEQAEREGVEQATQTLVDLEKRLKTK